MSKKYLIVGGVAGGASTAARLRRLDEHAQIIMFEKGPHVSFSNCCLPNFLSREVPSSDNLVLMNPEIFKTQYNIEARVNNEVVKVNPKKKTIIVKNLVDGEKYEESYDKLVLSPGAVAIRPASISGIHGDNVFVVKNVGDVVAIDNFLVENDVKDVVVVGGGFIGVECAEALVHAGKNVSMVEAADQIMAPLDYEMAQILHKELHDNGVNLIVGDSLNSVEKEQIILGSGKKVKAQAVVLAIGVRPDIDIAVKAGIEIGETGGILVDQNYRTNFKDIYAVGDAIQVQNRITNSKTKLPLAGPAQKQARSAADAINGRTVMNRGVIGSSVVRVFNKNAASTGLSEKDCIKHGMDYDYVYFIPNDKVGLMPNHNAMFFKLLFESPTGRILGAQAIGKGNVDKRIDVIAAMITMGGYIEDLKELELCYAPPFGTAKDIVNHAALVGLNLLYKEYKQVPVYKVRELVESGAYIIDVREKDEYELSHIKGAKNIPMSEFRQRLDEFPKDRPVYLHCRSSQRSYNVVRALGQLGFDNMYNISGSFLGICYYEYFNDVTQNREPIVTDYNFN